MDQKKRTNAQIKLQQNLKNAGETLKAHGLKAHTKDKHALVKHRRQGKPNSEFFEEFDLKTPRLTVRKPITFKQSNVNSNNEFVEMITETSNALPKTQSSYRNNSHRNSRKINMLKRKSITLRKRAEKIKEDCENKINKLIKLAEDAEERSMINTSQEANSGKAIQLKTPEISVKPRNNVFVKAGRKGLTSEKGRAWHANIAKARQDIQTFLRSQGITEKPTGTVAIQYASMLRKDPSSAATFKNKLLTTMRNRNRSQAPKKVKASTRRVSFNSNLGSNSTEALVSSSNTSSDSSSNQPSTILENLKVKLD